MLLKWGTPFLKTWFYLVEQFCDGIHCTQVIWFQFCVHLQRDKSTSFTADLHCDKLKSIKPLYEIGSNSSCLKKAMCHQVVRFLHKAIIWLFLFVSRNLCPVYNPNGNNDGLHAMYARCILLKLLNRVIFSVPFSSMFAYCTSFVVVCVLKLQTNKKQILYLCFVGFILRDSRRENTVSSEIFSSECVHVQLALTLWIRSAYYISRHEIMFLEVGQLVCRTL